MQNINWPFNTMISKFVLIILSLINPLSFGSNLTQSYDSNITLSSAVTYYVVNNVVINVNVFFIVPGDVEIVFTGDYTINVQGNMIIGCETIDTSNNNNIGIAVESQLVIIHTDTDNSTSKGTIQIDQTGSGSFCNTKFENIIQISYYELYPNELLVDNCEFRGVKIDCHQNTEVSHLNNQITDNKFIGYGIDNAIYMNIVNNVFEDISSYGSGSAISFWTVNNIFNNTFNNANYGVFSWGGWTDSDTNITFNTFTNLEYAIYIDGSSYLNIMYNEFIDNTVAIYFRSGITQEVHYNNFINSSWYTIIVDTPFNQPLCGYNYFGTSSTNQADIAQQVYDLCDGGARSADGISFWWPWYTEPIDFDLLPTIDLTESTLKTLLDCDPGLHPEITGTRVNTLYIANITLTLADSPYYIVNDVQTNSDVTVVIESGVELIFVDDYVVYIGGSLVMGCNGNTSQSIIVSSIDNSIRQGTIEITGYGSASFCNTKFLTIKNAIYYKGKNPAKLFVNQCNFYNNYQSIYFNGEGTAELHQVTANNFTNNRYSIYNARYMHIEDNIFNNMDPVLDETAVRTYGDSNIFNNVFIYKNSTWDHDTEAMRLYGSNINVTFNIFHNWNPAILSQANVNIKYNTFNENNVAIAIYSNSQQQINYNNFIDNVYNIKLHKDVDQSNCNFNWNGVVNDIADPRLTAHKIWDSCDSNGYDGIVTFWPYFGAPLDFNGSDVTDLPKLYTFNFINCSTINGNGTMSQHYNITTTPPTTSTLASTSRLILTSIYTSTPQTSNIDSTFGATQELTSTATSTPQTSIIDTSTLESTSPQTSIVDTWTSTTLQTSMIDSSALGETTSHSATTPTSSELPTNTVNEIIDVSSPNNHRDGCYSYETVISVAVIIFVGFANYPF